MGSLPMAITGALGRGLAGAGLAGCILAAVLLMLAIRARGSDRQWAEGNEGLILILAGLVLASFFAGMVML